MTQRDLERVLRGHAENVHLSDDERRKIRLTAKEEQPVKRKMSMALVAAMILIMLAAVGVAASGGIMDFLKHIYGKKPVLSGGEELFEGGIAVCEDEYVTYTVKEGVYDGHGVALLVEVTPKDEKTLVMDICPLAFMEYSDMPCMPPMNVSEDDQRDVYEIIREYAAENGYERVALVQGAINSPFGHSAMIEWQDNTLTMLMTTVGIEENENGTVQVKMQFESIPLKNREIDKEALRWNKNYVVTSYDFARKPLEWTAEAIVNADVLEYGLHIENVTLEATKLGVYAKIGYRILDGSKADDARITLVNEQRELEGYGVIGIVRHMILSSGMSIEEGTTGILEHSMIASDKPPETIYLCIENPKDPLREPVYLTIPLK